MPEKKNAGKLAQNISCVSLSAECGFNEAFDCWRGICHVRGMAHYICSVPLELALKVDGAV